MSQISLQDINKQFTIVTRKKGWKSFFSGGETKLISAISEINLKIEQGEFIALLGPNGAGKSTLIKIMLGLMKPSSGDVSVLDVNPLEQRDKIISKLGVVFGQRSRLWYDLPVHESFDLTRKLYGVADSTQQKEWETYLYENIDIQHLLERQVKKLSLGEKMRCELVNTLLYNPDILFLDEPTIGLDVVSKIKIREALKVLNSRGKTIILTSHDTGDIENLCRRVVIINKGKVEVDQPIEQFLKINDTSSVVFTCEQEVTEKILTNLKNALKNKIVGLQLLNTFKLEVEVKKSAISYVFAAVAKQLTISDVAIKSEDVETVLLKIYQQKD